MLDVIDFDFVDRLFNISTENNHTEKYYNVTDITTCNVNNSTKTYHLKLIKNIAIMLNIIPRN